MSNEHTAVANRLALQGQLIAMIRAFGLHHPEQTPCGQPVAVAEAHALIELAHEQPMSQNDLAGRLQLEKSTVSRLVGLLEGRGWIQRSRAVEDRRVMQLWLTEAGLKAADELGLARQKKFARVLAAIPPEQQAFVLEAMSILVEAMRESE